MLTDQRRVELSAELDQSGSAQVVVRETLTGQPASEWRDQVEHMAEDKLRQALEQRALGYFFPGASLHELTYGPMDDDNAPLLITYRFTAPHLARQRLGKDGRKQLVLTVPYPLLLSRRYVTAPQRQLPLIVSYVTPGTLTADIKLPVGARVAQLAEPVTEHGFGSYIRQVRSDGGHRAAVGGKQHPSAAHLAQELSGLCRLRGPHRLCRGSLRTHRPRQPVVASRSRQPAPHGQSPVTAWHLSD
jgi:hypothetical protein